ncbi:MAG: hypothetical protein LBU91_03040, partial [Bacteroidales bacterium]|nr:hypothetical protein [Bacteroidales bacterium]
MKTMKSAIVLLFALSGMSVFAQKWGATPEDSVECIKNLSMYQEFYKQRNYVDAYEPWLWIFNNCPANHVNTFIRGTAIVKTQLNKEKDPEKRKELVELLYSIWDKRAEYFGEPGKNMGYKALDMKLVQPKRVKDYYPIFKQALEL